jgi:peroxiredoxin
MKLSMLTFFLSLVAAATTLAQQVKIGSPVSDFQLTRLSGAPVQFSALKGDVTLLMFVSVQCPVSNAYNERMSALHNDYASKGVKFIVVNANRTEPASTVGEHAREHNFPFTVYKDEKNVVADAFGATVTPETYVIDSAGILRYHGSIDDSQNPTRVTARRLRAALDAVLAGQEPPQTTTKAFGCTIKRVSKT